MDQVRGARGETSIWDFAYMYRKLCHWFKLGISEEKLIQLMLKNIAFKEHHLWQAS